MDIFKEIRERVEILEVCNILGIKLNRNYKAICPFHKEKTPSFSVSKRKNIFCCFGCGKKGDSITLVSEMLKISPLEAVKYLNSNLHLGLDLKAPTSYYEINKYKEKRNIEEEFKKWELKTYILICEYLHLLWRWQKEYEPKNIEEISDLYIEAMNNKDYIKYLIDEIFINGTNEDKIWFWKHERKWVRRIETRIRAIRAINE